jgi:Ni/Co efflux regulator RcnB
MKKTRTLICSVAIASIGFAAIPSFAQPRQEAREDIREGRQDRREATRDIREGRRDLRQADTPREAREARQDIREGRSDRREARSDVRDARQDLRYYNARSPEFRRGGRLPVYLRNNTYVVSDWRGHRLTAPPRGYHWVQVGPDYVLVAITTGIIASLILSQ